MHSVYRDIYKKLTEGYDQNCIMAMRTGDAVRFLTKEFNQRYDENFLFLGDDEVSEIFVLNNGSSEEYERHLVNVLKFVLCAGVSVTILRRSGL